MVLMMILGQILLLSLKQMQSTVVGATKQPCRGKEASGIENPEKKRQEERKVHCTLSARPGDDENRLDDAMK